MIKLNANTINNSTNNINTTSTTTNNNNNNNANNIKTDTKELNAVVRSLTSSSSLATSSSPSSSSTSTSSSSSLFSSNNQIIQQNSTRNEIQNELKSLQNDVTSLNNTITPPTPPTTIICNKSKLSRSYRSQSEPPLVYYHSDLATSRRFLFDSISNRLSILNQILIDESPTIKLLFDNIKKRKYSLKNHIRSNRTSSYSSSSSSSLLLLKTLTATESRKKSFDLLLSTKNRKMSATTTIQDLLINNFSCTMLVFKRSFSYTHLKCEQKYIKKSSSFEKFLQNVVKGKQKSQSICILNSLPELAVSSYNTVCNSKITCIQCVPPYRLKHIDSTNSKKLFTNTNTDDNLQLLADDDLMNKSENQSNKESSILNIVKKNICSDKHRVTLSLNHIKL